MNILDNKCDPSQKITDITIKGPTGGWDFAAISELLLYILNISQTSRSQ